MAGLLRIIAILALLGAMPAWAAEPVDKVTIAQFGKERFLLYLPLYVAMEEGLFAKHGVDVTLKFAGNDDQIFAAVIGGAAQFGMGDPVFAAISHDKGGPGKVVAMMLTRLALAGVTDEEKIPQITNPAQLDNLRVSSFPEPSTTYTYLSQIKQKQAPHMQIVQAPFGGQLALLEAGQVDIALDIEPAISIMENRGYRAVVDITPWTDAQAVTGLMTTEDIIKARPETVRHVVEGLQDAVELLYRDPDAGYRTAAKLYPNLSEPVVRHAVDRMMKNGIYPRSVAVNDALWQRTLKTRLDSGDLKHAQATSVAVDNEFVPPVRTP
jgi:NitT/TauT family transport system substrate-binding protein